MSSKNNISICLRPTHNLEDSKLLCWLCDEETTSFLEIEVSVQSYAISFGICEKCLGREWDLVRGMPVLGTDSGFHEGNVEGKYNNIPLYNGLGLIHRGKQFYNQEQWDEKAEEISDLEENVSKANEKMIELLKSLNPETISNTTEGAKL